MFQPGTLHTDFGRQLTEDRLAAVRIARRPRRSGGPSLATRLAAALHGRAAVRPAAEQERPARASVRTL